MATVYRSHLQTARGPVAVIVETMTDPMLCNSKCLCISAYAVAGGAAVEYAHFFPNDDAADTVSADGDPGVRVEPEWRRFGIATALYAAVEAAGYCVRQSSGLTDDGAAFWKALYERDAR